MLPDVALSALPLWPAGTPAVLCVAGPHAIPVSTAVRAGDWRLLFALGGRRESLKRLRADGRCTLCLLAEGVAFSAAGSARAVRDKMNATPRVAALELRVELIHDHLADGRTLILDAVRWVWSDPQAEAQDRQIRTELAELARASG